MANFLKRGIEFNNLSKAFNRVYEMINHFEYKMRTDFSFDAESSLYILAFISRKEIVDRMEEYCWTFDAPIVVLNIHKGRISLDYAYELTIGKIISIGEGLGISVEISEILSKDDLFFQLQETMPCDIKKKYNL